MSGSAAAASTIAGRFVLQSLAGAGGVGTVFRARDTLTGRTVALKLLQPRTRQDTERFAREAQLLSELQHPGIVTYLAHGETHTGRPYLAMEWLEGEDLSQRLSRGPLLLPDALVLLRRAAEALALAHARGVVHRDLKPSNLFLREGQVDRVALLDFGIAQHAEVFDVLTKTGTVLGTPSYMAPEQARGERHLTAAADIFSLGCVLFECLAGRPPFAADHALAVLGRIMFDEPPSLCRVRPELSESIDVLLGRMLAKQAESRLADATALLAALDASEPMRSSIAPSRPSAGGERQLLSVLMAVSPTGSFVATSPLASTLADNQLDVLHRELSDHGARVEVLPDGSLVATLRNTRGAATDQAARAARCALLIKARWPGARIALGTGSGLADAQGHTGEVFHRAAALLRDHTATPVSEEILLDEATRGLLDVRFVVSRTTTGAYTLTGEELALDASRPLLGKPTPCVGRELELGMIERAFSGCIEDAEPRGVLLTAPSGTGKSRLWHELLRRLQARGDNVLVLIGRGDAMMASSSYSLLGQALRRLCGIVDGESIEARRHKLALRLGKHIAAAERQRVTSFAGELCGIPLLDDDSAKLRAARQDPQIMRDQITQAVLDVLRAECAERPVLLVLEDLQWADAPTVKLVEEALRRLKACPLMMLALARPEVHEVFPRLWPTAVQAITLRPLGKKAGERLVQQVLGTQVAKETIDRIVAQSEGNALLLEELIRATAEGRGGAAPETVLAMLQARIGRLEPDVRRALRAASVFGETCWRGGIRTLLDGPVLEQLKSWLDTLLKEEILEERAESRFPGEPEYKFRYALMRDAAYGLLAETDRVASHRIAGEYLEARGEPDALVLAEHFAQGREPARAIPYYILAAEQSYEAFDMDAAMASAERGLACGAQGEQRGALLSVQSGVSQWRELYAEIMLGEAPWSSMLASLEGRQALRAAGDTRTENALTTLHAKTLMELGDRAGAEALLRESLAVAEQLNETFPLVLSRTYLARLLATFAPLDQLDEPARLAGEAITVKNMMLTGIAHGVLALIKLRQGHLAGAEQDARAACEAARGFPAYTWEPIALRSRILLDQARVEEALAIAVQGVQELERLDIGGFGEIALRLSLAEALHAAGKIEAAHAALAKTVERLRPRVDDIPEAAWRERYLTQVPTHARLLTLAREWLGIDIHASG